MLFFWISFRGSAETGGFAEWANMMQDGDRARWVLIHFDRRMGAPIFRETPTGMKAYFIAK